MPRTLVPYDPRWPVMFDEIAADMRAHGDPEWLIEEIGPTRVSRISSPHPNRTP